MALPDWGWFGAKFGVMLACGQEVPKTFDIRPRTAYQANARILSEPHASRHRLEADRRDLQTARLIAQRPRPPSGRAGRPGQGRPVIKPQE